MNVIHLVESLFPQQLPASTVCPSYWLPSGSAARPWSKGVGRIYQHTAIDTYSRVAFAKLYDRKNALVAADMLNDKVVPFFEDDEVRILRILIDYCGNREHHDFQLYMALENIDHTKTKARSPQTNGICERFHKTMLEEFYQVAFRKKLYESIEQLQDDVDEWLRSYNEERPNSGRFCFGKTPRQTFDDLQPSA